MATARLWHTNRIQAAAAALTASSFESAFPLVWLRDQMRTKRIRTKLGWNVSFWNKLDFTEDGSARVATLATANYSTGAAMATQIQTAMNAAPGAVNTYTVTYDSGTKKFTIARNAGTAAVVLKFGDGVNLAVSVHIDLGYTSTNKSGGTSYTAENVAYHSREWLKANLGSALAVTAGAVINHNLLAAGVVTLQGNASDAWTAPSFSQVLTADADNLRRIAFFASQSFQWWRLLIEDVQNPDGFSEVGIWYAGPYTQPSVGISIDSSQQPLELSAIELAIEGAHWQTQRGQPDARTLSFDEAPAADVTLLHTVRKACPRGKNLFLTLDAVDAPTDTLYGYFAGEWSLQPVGGGYETVRVPFVEAV